MKEVKQQYKMLKAALNGLQATQFIDRKLVNSDLVEEIISCSLFKRFLVGNDEQVLSQIRKEFHTTCETILTENYCQIMHLANKNEIYQSFIGDAVVAEPIGAEFGIKEGFLTSLLPV